MTKKILTVLLALLLSVGAAPFADARPADDGWLIYCAEIDKNTFQTIVVAPAKYTRLSDDPRIETVFTADRVERRVSSPAAEQIRFYSDGRTETRWTMTVTCAAPAGSTDAAFRCAVLPGSVLDDAGNGNARVFFEDETDYMRAEGYAEIDVSSGLLRRDYDRADDTVAVGDALHVDYSGLYPIEIFINRKKVAFLPGGELQRYTCDVTETDPLSVAVRQRGKQIATRSMTVITSAEMYERNLRDGLISGEDIPGTEDLVEAGVPLGSLFIPIAKIVAFLNSLRIFFQRLFSFVRIAN